MGRVLPGPSQVWSFASNRIAGHGNEGYYLAPRTLRVTQIAKNSNILADDHGPLLELIQGLLEPTFDVVGSVQDGESLVKAAKKLQPDVIVTDISDAGTQWNRCCLSDESLRLLVEDHIFDSTCGPRFRSAALKAGAVAYVWKFRVATDLLVAIGEVLAGRTFISSLESVV